jgi:hypothetical protein
MEEFTAAVRELKTLANKCIIAQDNRPYMGCLSFLESITSTENAKKRCEMLDIKLQKLLENITKNLKNALNGIIVFEDGLKTRKAFQGAKCKKLKKGLDELEFMKRLIEVLILGLSALKISKCSILGNIRKQTLKFGYEMSRVLIRRTQQEMEMVVLIIEGIELNQELSRARRRRRVAQFRRIVFFYFFVPVARIANFFRKYKGLLRYMIA